MTQIIGKETTQNITDQYEVWTTRKQLRQSNSTLLSHRLNRLVEYQAGRDLTSEFNTSGGAEIATKLINHTISDCMDSLYRSRDFVYCEISSSRYPPQSCEYLRLQSLLKHQN